MKLHDRRLDEACGFEFDLWGEVFERWKLRFVR